MVFFKECTLQNINVVHFKVLTEDPVRRLGCLGKEDGPLARTRRTAAVRPASRPTCSYTRKRRTEKRASEQPSPWSMDGLCDPRGKRTDHNDVILPTSMETRAREPLFCPAPDSELSPASHAPSRPLSFSLHVPGPSSQIAATASMSAARWAEPTQIMITAMITTRCPVLNDTAHAQQPDTSRVLRDTHGACACARAARRRPAPPS